MPTLVDLTQEIYHDQPVYHTHQKTVMWTDSSYEAVEHQLRKRLGGDDPPFTFETRALLLCDHGPTT